MYPRTITHHGITFNCQALSTFCIKKLSLFGSVLSNDFGPESDINIVWNTVKNDVPVLKEKLEMII